MKRRHLAGIILLVLFLAAGLCMVVRSGENPARAAPPARPLGDAPWSANVKVNDDLGSERQFAPAIAVDSSGNAYTVWYDYRNGLPDIYFSYRPTGGGWSTNVRVNDDPAGLNWQTGPDISVDGVGNAYAVWSDGRDGGNVYFSYRPAGGNWGANVKVTDVSASWGPATALAVDAAGNAYAIWGDCRNGAAGDIYFAYRPAGGNWGSNVKVNDDMGPDDAVQWRPDIAVDGAGNTYAVWKAYRNGEAAIYSSYRPAGGTWSPNVQVNDSPIEPADTSSNVGGPSIAVTMAGNSYALWPVVRSNAGVDETHLRFSFRPKGGSWSHDEQVDDSANLGDNAGIAVDGDGHLYVVWAHDRVYFSYRPPGDSWQPKEQVSDAAGSVGYCIPAVAVDSSGKAYTVWYDDRNGNLDIYFSYRPAGGGPLLQLPFNAAEQSWRCQSTRGIFNCLTAYFDHKYPDYGLDNGLLPFWGIPITDNIARGACNPPAPWHCYNGHDGYDFGLIGGTEVRAAAAGSAQYSGQGCLGEHIIIDHGNGYQTVYGHLQRVGLIVSTPGISVPVTAGQAIGKVGNTGCVVRGPDGDGSHLHFAAYYDGQVVDPWGWKTTKGSDPWEEDKDGPHSVCLWGFGCTLPTWVTSTSAASVTSPDGSTTVSIPAGAVTDTTLFELTLAPDPVAEPSAVPAGYSFDLSAQGIHGNAVETFLQPLTIVINYAEDILAHIVETTLTLHFWDDATQTWQALPTSVDLENNTATATTDHLSLFTLLGEPQNPAPTVTSVSPDSGYSHLDTETTIEGAGFLPTPSIRLGPNELAVTFVDSTTLTAVVPSGLDPSTYDLTVTNPDGQEASLADAFTVFPTIQNGSFEEDGRIPAPWKGKNLTLKDRRVCKTAHDGRCSFRMVGTKANKSLRQVVRISGSAGDSFTLRGWSKARNPLRRGGPYCLQARVFHTDGTKKNYRACFAKRTHTWQRRKTTFTIAKDYNKIVVFLLYFRQGGKAWFDDVRLVVH